MTLQVAVDRASAVGRDGSEPGSASVALVDLGVPLAARPSPERPVVRCDLCAAV